MENILEEENNDRFCDSEREKKEENVRKRREIGIYIDSLAMTARGCREWEKKKKII